MAIKWPFTLSFEGIDKCGKRTQMFAIKDWLKTETGKDVFSMSHPNDQFSLMGQHIRRILQHEVPFPGNLELQKMFTVDQAQSWHCWIQPALEQGSSVLLERYHHSTLAYSLACGQISEVDMISLRGNIIGETFKWPDMTFIIDISPEEAMRRMEVTRERPEYFEKEDRLKQVRSRYFILVGRYGRAVLINGERPKEEVTENIKAIIRQNFF